MSAPDARTPGGNRASAGQSTDDAAIVPAATFCGNPRDDHKAFNTTRAEFALLGYELHGQAGGSVVVRRWGLTREFASVLQAREMLRQIGGKS